MKKNLDRKQNNLVVVILGTTSSGKTALGVKLADYFNGEIISADSRQVYIGMDIGTGKDLKEYTVEKKVKGRMVAKKIPSHLIDVVKPQTKFSLAKYQRLAAQAIVDIQQRHKLPIIVGGTGLYLQAVVDNYQLDSHRIDVKKRQELEKLSENELLARLEGANSVFAKKMNNSDRHNPRRLTRYIEILEADHSFQPRSRKDQYDFLLLGLDWPKEILNQRIHERLVTRLEEEDLVAEIKGLHHQGVSWKRLESFGLEYKFVSWYLQNKIDYEEMVQKLSLAICQFAKRQKTWWKRWEKQGRKINWVKDFKAAKDIIKERLR